jgi:hypothetical protein
MKLKQVLDIGVGALVRIARIPFNEEGKKSEGEEREEWLLGEFLRCVEADQIAEEAMMETKRGLEEGVRGNF